jgi:uncharacterized repeat protein (TIGR01451 family)
MLKLGRRLVFRQRRPATGVPRRYRPRLEALEDRRLLSIITPFTPRFRVNAPGDIRVIGNTLMTAPDSDPGAADARAARGTRLDNNDFNMTYVDVDTDPTTFDSSRATLDLPDGAAVLWAGLYWGADSPDAARTTALFAAPGAAGYLPLNGTLIGASGTNYQAFAEVTSVVRAAGKGEYGVANVHSTTGSNRYAGWSLVVVFATETGPPRNLTVFDGFAVVQASDPAVSFDVNGFTTPLAGPVAASLSEVAYEGDLALTGDSLHLNGVALTDAQHPADNFFNSTISDFGVPVTQKSPDYLNQLGFDANTIDVSSLLPNGSSAATIKLSTLDDTYYPGVIATAIDLYAPQVAISQTAADLNGGAPRAGDVLQYTVRVRNEGGDTATALVLTDLVPPNTSYVPGSLAITEGAGAGPLTDAPLDDRGEFDPTQNQLVFRLGPNLLIGDETAVTFRVRVRSDAAVGTLISDQARVDFVGLTTGLALNADSLAVTSVVEPPANAPPGNSVAPVPPSGNEAAPAAGETATEGGGVSPATPANLPGTVAPANHPPVVVAELFSVVAGGGPTFLPVLANDSDPDGDRLSIASFTSARFGAVALSGSAGLTYTPASGFLGTDLFGYTATDGLGGFGSATVTVRVVPPRVQAVDDFLTVTNRGSPIALDVLANDIVPPGTTVAVSSATTAAGGTVRLAADGATILYQPPPAFVGTDSFGYTLTDLQGNTSSAQVTLTVLAAQAPSSDALLGTVVVPAAAPQLPLADARTSGAVTFAAATAAARGLAAATAQGGDDSEGGDPTRTARISGVVFHDRDGDGVRDTQREPGWANFTVVLERREGGVDVPVRTTSTNGDGWYEFDRLRPGVYRVRVTLPPGQRLTSPAGRLHVVELEAGGRAVGRSFGTLPISPVRPALGPEEQTPRRPTGPDEEARERQRPEEPEAENEPPKAVLERLFAGWLADPPAWFDGQMDATLPHAPLDEGSRGSLPWALLAAWAFCAGWGASSTAQTISPRASARVVRRRPAPGQGIRPALTG